MSDWDDGIHKKVKKVTITHGDYYVNTIQVDYYDDDDKTVRGKKHGGNPGKYSKQITIEPDEYIKKMYCYKVDNYVGGLQLKTNHERVCRAFGKSSINTLVFAPEGCHLVGFSGKSDDDRLLDLDAYVAPLNSFSLDNWDDGTHDNVKAIHVTYSDEYEYGEGKCSIINSIQVDYFDGPEIIKGRLHGTIGNKSDGFELQVDEYLMQAIVYFNENGKHTCGFWFRSNKRSLGPYGKKTSKGYEIRLPEGYQIVGFRGISGLRLRDFDAHVRPIKLSNSGRNDNDTNVSSGTQLTSSTGGNHRGKQWDDGANHDSVRKITLGVGRKGIHYIQFDYERNGLLNYAPIRGLQEGTFSPPPFEINDPDEYLVLVSGYYKDDIVQGLQFVTNKRESQVFGYKEGTEFTLKVKDEMIVGFHGHADTTLNSLRAYFVPVSSFSTSNKKLEVQGGKGGKEWDDGANHKGVRKIVVGAGRQGIHFVKFDYDMNEQLKDTPVHGLTDGAFIPPPTFEIDHPSEYLVSVMGYYENDIIQGLQFKTNNRESQIFGYSDGTRFTLAIKDNKIVGFHGYAEMYINSIGAYFSPTSSSPSSAVRKLVAQGGKGETTFDDGAFKGVRKVYIGQGDSGVAYVKFEYDKGSEVEAIEHGKKTMLGAEEFELEPEEYITSVEGYHDKVFGHEVEVITALIFKTSKGRASIPYGIAAGTKFELGGEGDKIVGFHGSVDDFLHSLGAYFAPSNP